MIHPLVKIITVDGFFKEEDATRMYHFVGNLKYEENEFGKEVTNFNLVTPDQGAQFSQILNTNITVDEEKSGIFRYPHWFIHFEGFDSMNEWVFAVALQQSTFNVYENKRGPKTALEGYQLNYQNLFEWDLLINYILKPGQGILFRPWLFHSFDNGLIQIFRLREQNDS